MKLRPANTRGYLAKSWKDEDNYESYRSFSCMSYWDPNYMSWGPVVTINDDRTKPGFITTWHEHKGSDILNYMIKGECRHKDDKGNDNIANATQVQHFWCGPSMYHHLSNESDSDNRYLQIWIMPNSIDNSPMTYQVIDREPGFSKLPINFKNTRISVWGGNLLEPFDITTHSYVLVLEGNCKVNDIELNEGDALDVTQMSTITTDSTAHIIMFQMR